MAFLPESIWKRRLESEFKQMSASSEKFVANAERTEYEVTIVGKGFFLDGVQVKQRREHKVRIKLLRNFPYAGGIEVVWKTPIFHPNIRQEDGKVCIQLLNNWAASMSVLSLVAGLRQLLENPNLSDPLDKMAAEYFSGGKLELKKYSSVPGMPRILQ